MVLTVHAVVAKGAQAPGLNIEYLVSTLSGTNSNTMVMGTAGKEAIKVTRNHEKKQGATTIGELGYFNPNWSRLETTVLTAVIE